MSFARYIRALSLCGLISIGLAGGANAQSAQTWGFEDGTLQGWIATGNAFTSQPTFGNNLPPRRPGEFANQVGNYWIGTYEDRPNPGVMLGRIQGDGPQGTLLSPPFTISGPRISFRVGGGNDREREYVALMLRTPRRRSPRAARVSCAGAPGTRPRATPPRPGSRPRPPAPHAPAARPGGSCPRSSSAAP